MTDKQEVLRVMAALPDEAKVEDAIERLYLLYKVRQGLAQADAGDTITQEEARRQMSRWLS